MGLPQVDFCCCGCSLRTGSCVIGFLCLIGSLSSTISASVYAQNLDYDGDYAIAVTQAVLAACMLVTNVFLVLGTLQNKPSYVKPWVILNGIILAIEAAIYVGLFILMLMYGVGIGLVLGSLAAFFIVFGIAFYFLVVVNSFHRSLISSNNILNYQPPNNPPMRDPTPAYPYPPTYSLPRVQVVPVAVSPPPYTSVTVQGLVVVQEQSFATAPNTDPYAKY